MKIKRYKINIINLFLKISKTITIFLQTFTSKLAKTIGNIQLFNKVGCKTKSKLSSNTDRNEYGIQ